LDWKGWHAYRRGLARNLHELGILDKIIQAILRQEGVKTTQTSYQDPADADIGLEPMTCRLRIIGSDGTPRKPKYFQSHSGSKQHAGDLIRQDRDTVRDSEKDANSEARD
jgi:hypothetical protein